MSEEISKYELFNKYEEAIRLCKLDYELFPDDNEHLLTAIEALEKQISRKPKQYTDSFKIAYYFCPVCEYIRVRSKQKRCENCGQLLDWEAENA